MSRGTRPIVRFVGIVAIGVPDTGAVVSQVWFEPGVVIDERRDRHDLSIRLLGAQVSFLNRGRAKAGRSFWEALRQYIRLKR